MKATMKPGTSGKATRAAVASALALLIAKPAEGLYLTTYYDPVGILTACYGTTGPEVVKGKRYTLAQCEAYLDADMRQAIATIEKCAPGLPVPVLAAFADAAYNVGPRIACDPANSTAARYLRQYSQTTYLSAATGDKLLVAACNQLPRWDKAKVMGKLVPLKGLTKRRGEERDLCLKGVSA